MPSKAATRDYADAVKPGRLLAHQWELHNAVLQVGNMYGWTGGIKGSNAANRTNDLLAIVVNEFNLQGPGPKMLVGDLNGTLRFNHDSSPDKEQRMYRLGIAGAAVQWRQA